MTDAHLCANVRSHVLRASPEQHADGVAWYREANRAARRLARTYRMPERRVAGIIAALSPRQRWSVNLRTAERVCAAISAGEPMPSGLGLARSVEAAWRIANGARPLDVLTGRKVRAFYRNIVGDLTHVTVDTWAIRAAGLEAEASIAPALFARITNAYRTVAAEVGLEPAEAQAVAWVVVRGGAA